MVGSCGTRILHVIPRSDLGGAQTVCLHLVTNLNSSKFNIQVACGGGGPLVDTLTSKNIRVHEIPTFCREISVYKDLKTLFGLYNLIKNEKINLVHCHSVKGGLLGRVAARLAGVELIIYTVHGLGFDYGKWSLKQFLLMKLESIYQYFTDRYVFVSQNDYDFAISNGMVPAGKGILIKNGSNPTFDSLRNIEREKLFFSDFDFVIGMVARLEHPKNPMMFLVCARQIIAAFPNVKFVLVGKGGLIEDCATYISEYHLEDNILLLGEVSHKDTLNLMLALDLFVLTSYWEGLPVSILEALFASLPIIATNVGGIPELVINGYNGFLVDVDDANSLTERIKEIISTPSLKTLFSQNSLKLAIEQFHTASMLSSYEQIYSQIISRN